MDSHPHALNTHQIRLLGMLWDCTSPLIALFCRFVLIYRPLQPLPISIANRVGLPADP